MDQIRVLLVEDDEDDFILTRRLLISIYGEGLKLDWANTYDSALRVMKADQHDVCLLDYRLGNEDGLNLLREANADGYGVPVIFMTGQADREIDLEAMHIGAADYLLKGQTDASLLERSIRYAIQQKRSEAARLDLIREQTARREAEEANRVKDEFLATLSHELRTPLHSMLGWVHMLRKGALSPDQTANALEVIERNVHAQHRLVEDILDLSRIITNKLQMKMHQVSLGLLIKSVIESVRSTAEAKNISLEAKIDLRKSNIWGDADRLQQVVYNLISNAIKFTPRGGSVAVFLSYTQTNAEIVVRDTGEGIAPEFLPHVFDTFRQQDGSTTRRFGGLGLGLAIVRHLTELHGGQVQAESGGSGQGAAFTVTLPLLETAPSERDDTGKNLSEVAVSNESVSIAHTKTQPQILSGIKVLIIDDDYFALDLARTILEQDGAQVKTADTPAVGRTLFESWQPNLVLCDIGLPGEDGYSLIGQMREIDNQRGTQTPTIALTAYARAEDRAQALKAGFNRHIAKPVEPETLLAAVVELTSQNSRTQKNYGTA